MKALEKLDLGINCRKKKELLACFERSCFGTQKEIKMVLRIDELENGMNHLRIGENIWRKIVL